MDKEAAEEYLASLLNKNLRIVVTDGRLFWGQFKCVDANRNVVLAHAYEYRHPSRTDVTEAQAPEQEQEQDAADVVLEMTSRYIGTIVVPGQHVVKMEVEEFASQQRGV